MDNARITATVEMPARKAPKEVVLRFRHPKTAPIKSVTVNGPSTGSGQGKPWTDYNKDKETIILKGLSADQPYAPGSWGHVGGKPAGLLPRVAVTVGADGRTYAFTVPAETST